MVGDNLRVKSLSGESATVAVIKAGGRHCQKCCVAINKVLSGEETPFNWFLCGKSMDRTENH